MKVLALYNIKGGTGKTASAVNLAWLSTAAGAARSLLWDLDPQGAVSYFLRLDPGEAGGARVIVSGQDLEPLIRSTDFDGLDVVPSDHSYRQLDLALDGVKKPSRRIRRLLQPLAGRYDWVFLDCPTSISHASEAVFAAADALLVPTVPTPLSIRTLAQLRSHLEQRGAGGPRLLPFFCMVDRRKKLHRDPRSLVRTLPVPFLETEIPYASPIERMGVHRKPVGSFARSSKAAKAYEALWREVAATA